MDQPTVIFLIILISVILLLFLASFLSTKGEKKKWKEDVKRKIKSLSIKANTDDITTLKQLLIEADKTLDHTLKQSGIKGGSMGKRLKNAQKYYNWNLYDKLWKAHKVRNRLVHEMDYKVSANELKKRFYELKHGTEEIL